MAHASKSFVVFTGGEWSEQLHGRTDLAKADAAGRKVRNFVPAQTGRLFRRKGLEFVGAALGECLAGDPRFTMPTWSALTEAETIDPTTDVYGSLGPEELRTSEDVGPIWQVCANIQYCDGPTEEGATMQDIGDRYRTRWVAKLEDDCVYYRRVGTGEDWTQVPNELIPQPNDMLNGLGFCFDANARPCFASAIGDDIHIWRWVAGVPTEYSFPGQGPRLYFNGSLQWQNSYWDVMCYFCWNGDLVATFQRENFLTNYTLFTDEDYYFTRVRLVERGSGDDDCERMYIAGTGKNNLYGLFRSGLYPLWPLFVREAPLLVSATPAGGSYWPITITLPTATDSLGLAAIPAGGEYRAIRITFPTVHESLGLAAAPAPTGNKYWPIRIDAGTYHEFVGLAAAPAPTGSRYWLVRVNAGTYQDHFTLSATPAGGTYAPV